jgi:hypothetical protein
VPKQQLKDQPECDTGDTRSLAQRTVTVAMCDCITVSMPYSNRACIASAAAVRISSLLSTTNRTYGLSCVTFARGSVRIMCAATQHQSNTAVSASEASCITYVSGHRDAY